MSAQQVTALMAEALGGIISDPSIQLSPPSRILANTIATTFTTVGDALGNQATELAADLGGELVVDAVADVAESIPLVGTVISMVKAMFTMAAATDALSDERLERQKWVCERSERFFVPVASRDLAIVPADLFGLYDADDARKLGGTFEKSGNVMAVCMPNRHDLNPDGSQGPGLVGGCEQRPLIGQCLIWLTEEVGVRNTATNGVKLEPIAASVPPTRRALFRVLRLAIEGQRKMEPRLSGDGGVSLWPIYLDLLNSVVCTALPCDNKPVHPSFMYETLLARTGCERIQTARQITAYVDRWNLTLNPWYSQDMTTLATWNSEADAIAKQTGGLHRLSSLAAALAHHTKRRIRLPGSFKL